MNEKNGNTRAWIAIIISIVIAFSGLMFGIIKGTSSARAEEVLVEVKEHTIQIGELQRQYAVIDERLSNIQELLKSHMGK